MQSTILLVESCGPKKVHYRQRNPLRIERVIPGIGKNLWLTLCSFFKDIILPYGYPDSVSRDYFEYQLWDTLQAFCSTITGSFTTRAILKGVGVGDANASALSATITWIVKDGSGMIGRILFAWWKGSMLDCDCKKWRLFADALNDLAMAIELGIPFYSNKSMEILCFTSMLKSIVGIAGGATRASITNHQAKLGNMAEISAKDGTQETMVNLLASFLSLYFLGKISNPMFELPFVFLLMSLHLYFNFKAVKCLVFDTLNDSRMVLTLKEFFLNNSLHPTFINRKESVILGIASDVSDICNFKIKLGCSLKRIVELYNSKELESFLQLYEGKSYLIFTDVENKCIYIGLEKNCDTQEILESYVHGVMLAMATSLYNNMPLKIPVIRRRNYINSVAKLESFMKSIQRSSDYPRNMTPDEIKQFNEYVEAEISMFLITLNLNDWKTHVHSLCIGQWKVDWKSHLNKNE